ncbi:hypothetical protein GMA06_04110 [Granulicatella sp. zg-84]|nr:hypothetical protein [Granulicatella sp. zg-84]
MYSFYRRTFMTVLFKKQANYPLTNQHNQTFEATCYHYINKQEQPDIAKALYEGTLFQAHDPHTNEVTSFTYPCLYEDSQKKFLVFFIPNDTVAFEDVSATMFEGGTNDYSDYTLRFTNYVTEFYEKINILDSQLLDTEVECVKLFTHTLLQEQNQLKENTHLFFHEESGKPFIMVLSPNNQARVDYNQDLVDIVHNRIENKLHLPKGQLFHVNGKWAIDALDLA